MQEQPQTESGQPMDTTALEPTTELQLKLEDVQTKNTVTVQVQLFNKEDQLTLVQRVTEASVQALVRMGLVEPEAVEMKTQIHTIAYRKQ